MQQHLGLALTSRNPGKRQGGHVQSILSLCCPPPGTFGPFLHTFSKALGMPVHSGRGTFLAPLRLKPPFFAAPDTGSQPGATLTRTSWTGPGPVVEQSRGRTRGKQVRLQVASNPDRKYLLWVSGKSSIFLSWVFHDWACYYVLGVTGVNRLLKREDLAFILSSPGDGCVLFTCFYAALQSEAQGLIWLQPGPCQTCSCGRRWGEKCLRDPWREIRA